MCDASDFAVGAVLGQRVDKKLNIIHYASKTLDSAQRNYANLQAKFGGNARTSYWDNAHWMWDVSGRSQI